MYIKVYHVHTNIHIFVYIYIYVYKCSNIKLYKYENKRTYKHGCRFLNQAKISFWHHTFKYSTYTRHGMPTDDVDEGCSLGIEAADFSSVKFLVVRDNATQRI